MKCLARRTLNTNSWLIIYFIKESSGLDLHCREFIGCVFLNSISKRTDSPRFEWVHTVHSWTRLPNKPPFFRHLSRIAALMQTHCSGIPSSNMWLSLNNSSHNARWISLVNLETTTWGSFMTSDLQSHLLC